MPAAPTTPPDALHFFESELRAGPGFYFPVRATAVALPAGVAVISPLPFDPTPRRAGPGSRPTAAWADAVDALGSVRWIVAPNTFHHLGLGDAMARWPDAEVWHADGLGAKRADLGLQAPRCHPLGTATAGPGARLRVPEAWAGDLEAFTIAGAGKVQEAVFHHRPSRTLLTTDLVFNHAPGAGSLRGWLTPLVFRMVGARHGCRQSRLWRWLLVDDRAAAGASVEALLALDFDRLVMAHGRVVERGGRDALRQGTAWMLGGVTRGALPTPSV